MWGVPPSPRPIAIIVLARNHEIIYGAQSFAGKILMSKNLRAMFSQLRSEMGRFALC